jgi:hypothetical protein
LQSPKDKTASPDLFSREEYLVNIFAIYEYAQADAPSPSRRFKQIRQLRSNGHILAIMIEKNQRPPPKMMNKNLRLKILEKKT